MSARKKELNRLETLQKETLPLASCSIQEYIKMISDIDTLCHDGVNDSQCSMSSHECACVYHKNM